MSVGLIVPDSHEQIVKLQRVLKKYEYVDWVLFLGDFMDSFNKLTWETHETVKWLRDNVANPKYTFLWGNHDMHYAFPLEGIVCSGYDPNKQKIVHAQLNHKDHWTHFKLMAWVGDLEVSDDTGNQDTPRKWLCSHAGVHPSLLHPMKGFDPQALQEMEDEAMWVLRYTQQVTAPIAIGRGRGGYARFGGVTWLDWSREFVPIEGLNQIVGHSFDKEIRSNCISGSSNYCIDTHLKHVVLMKDGKIEIEEVV